MAQCLRVNPSCSGPTDTVNPSQFIRLIFLEEK